MNNLKKEILLALTGIFAVIIVLNVASEDPFLNITGLFDLGEYEFEIKDDFEAFAIFIHYVYEILPQTAQVISIGTLGAVLLQRGFNPFILGAIVAFGKLTGQLTLYAIARFIRHKGKKWGENATVQHWLHKYHFLVFLFPAWTGTLGDIIMLYAGSQKVSVVRIIPILYVSNLAEAYKGIFPAVGQLELADGF